MFLFIRILLLFVISTVAIADEPVAAKHAMVVTEQHLASHVGLDILKQGGNAIDAAVAVGYALAVVNPCCGNLGGGGFMTLHLANGKNTFINFREKAPLAATETMYQDKSGNVIPGKSTEGYLAVGVPGTVMGMDYALKKYGTMTRQQVMAPAIKLAKEGYRLTQSDVAVMNLRADDFKKQTNVANIFLHDGHPYQASDLLVQSDLANTLRLISTQGAAAFYQGVIAKKIVAASRANQGILSLADFKAYSVEELAPITCTYHNYEIISAPPPSSGGITLCESLHILEGYPLKAEGFHSPASLHYMLETMRFAFADRDNQLGDPDFVNNPIQRLLSKQYAATVRSKIPANKAVPSTELPLGKVESNNTTHYSIMDKWGNAVSVTYTLNTLFGANVMASDTGFLLNDEMDDFVSKPGVANQFSLVGGKKNAIEPGKRPLSSMTPTIILQKNKLKMILGSPGGPRIITTILQTMLNTLDFNMNIQDAIDAGRVHQQWLPDVVYMEPNAIPSFVESQLQSMGYQFVINHPWGAVEAIVIDPATGTLYGGSDKRRLSGTALGY